MYAHLAAIAHAAATTAADRARCLNLLERARELDAKRSGLPNRIRELRTEAGISSPRSEADRTADPVREMDTLSPYRDRLMEHHHRPYNARSMIGNIISMIDLEPAYPTVDGIRTEQDAPAIAEYHRYLMDTKNYLRKMVYDWPV
jgi:hypothetical protein